MGTGRRSRRGRASTTHGQTGKPRHRLKNGASPRPSSGKGGRSPARQAVGGPGLHAPFLLCPDGHQLLDRARPAGSPRAPGVAWSLPAALALAAVTQGCTAHPTDPSSSPPLPKEPADPRPPHHTPPCSSEPGAPLAPPAQAARVRHGHQSSAVSAPPAISRESCLRGSRRKESEGAPHFTGAPQACPSISWLPASARGPEPRAQMGDGRGPPVLWLQLLAPTRP